MNHIQSLELPLLESFNARASKGIKLQKRQACDNSTDGWEQRSSGGRWT